VITSALGGVGAGLAGDEPVPPRPTRRRAAHAHLGGIEQAELPAGAQVGDHVGQRVQPEPAFDGAAALGQQPARLPDRPGDRRAGHPKPAGQHVVGDSVA
jgi:hypothetical protein